MRATPRDRRFASTMTRAAVMIGDVGGPLRIVRVGRMLLERRAVRDADEVGAERARLGLDRVGGERLPEDRDHQSAFVRERGLDARARLALS